MKILKLLRSEDSARQKQLHNAANISSMQASGFYASFVLSVQSRDNAECMLTSAEEPELELQ